MPEWDENLHPYSEKQLRWSYWYLKNREKLYRNLVFSLIVFTTICFVYVFWVLSDVFIFNFKNTEDAMNDLTTNYVAFDEYQKKHAPKDFSLGTLTTVPADKDFYTLAIPAKNPNDEWLVTQVKYRFVVGDEAQTEQATYFLPQEEKFLLWSNVPRTTRIDSVKLEIIGVEWQRVKNFAYLYQDRHNITVDGIKYEPAYVIDPEQKLKYKVGKLTFTIHNNTLFSFWEAAPQVSLYQGSKLVFVQDLSVPRLVAGEVREVSINVLSNISAVSQIKIIPSVNIFSSRSYFEAENYNKESF